MRIKLRPGDHVAFKSERGLRLRGVVAEGLTMKARGEELLVPVVRPRKGAHRVAADHDGHARHLALRWVPRNKLRKLPTK